MTLPTPWQIPSTTKDCTTGFTLVAAIAPAIRLITVSPMAPIPSESHAPIKLKVITKISPIIPRKQGIAVYFPVRTRSIAMLRLCSLLSCGLVTVFSQSFSIKVNRIFATAAFRSSPDSFSMTRMISEKAFSFSFDNRISFSSR